jgi:hypothetical protein
MKNQFATTSAARHDIKPERHSWLDLLTRPAAPLIAATLACSDNTLTAGTFTEPSGTIGVASLSFTNTNVAGSRTIQTVPVTFINQNTAITSARVFGDGIFAKNPQITIRLTTPDTLNHDVAVTNVTIFPGDVDTKSQARSSGVAILKLGRPLEKHSPIKIAATRPATRSFVFIPSNYTAEPARSDLGASPASTRFNRSVVTGTPRFGESPHTFFNAEISRNPHSKVQTSDSNFLGTGVFNQKGELVGLVSATAVYSFEVSATVLDLTNSRLKERINAAAGRD